MYITFISILDIKYYVTGQTNPWLHMHQLDFSMRVFWRVQPSRESCYGKFI